MVAAILVLLVWKTLPGNLLTPAAGSQIKQQTTKSDLGDSVWFSTTSFCTANQAATETYSGEKTNLTLFPEKLLWGASTVQWLAPLSSHVKGKLVLAFHWREKHLLMIYCAFVTEAAQQIRQNTGTPSKKGITWEFVGEVPEPGV